MRTLYLLRHAKSSWKDDSLADFDRPLKKRGREAAEHVGEQLAKEKIKDVVIVSSPALRTRETIEIALKSSGLKATVQFDPEIYEADVSTLLRVLGRVSDDQTTVVMVGHNPGMADFVRYLTGEIQAMPTAALAKIRFENSTWNDIKPAAGTLDWLITPREH